MCCCFFLSTQTHTRTLTEINVTISPDVVTVTEADTVLVFNVSRNDNVMLDRPVVIDVVDSEGQTGECMYECVYVCVIVSAACTGV